MNNAAIHIILRNIRTSGTEFVFRHYPMNDTGEILYDGESEEITLKGLFHESAGTRELKTADSGSIHSKNTSMFLTDYESAKDIRRYAECMISGDRFRVVSVIDVEQKGSIAEIVIERVQGDV